MKRILLATAILCALPGPARAVLTGTDGGDETAVALVFNPPPDMGGRRFCTGVLVGQRTVLTSASCAQKVQAALATSQAVFSAQASGTPAISIAGTRIHRRYEKGVSTFNVGVVYLTADPPIAATALNSSDPSPFLTQRTSTLFTVGYGGTGPLNTAGNRNFAYVPFLSLAPRIISSGTVPMATIGNGVCDGDSGAPQFADLGGNTSLVSVVGTEVGTTSSACSVTVAGVRVDALLSDFIYPAIDAFEGPCRHDGACVTSGCRTPDPDCLPANVCGPQGMCGSMCPQPDWDCPIGGQLGSECTTVYDCESRQCVPAVDDPRLSFCTDLCDPSAMNSCPHAMSCQMLGGKGVCVFDAPSPRAQNYPCRTNDECHSNMCDAVVQACVEPCDAANPCRSDLACRGSTFGTNVCVPSLENIGICGVSVASAGGGAAPWLLVGGIGLAGILMSRRRRS